jgi:hypothetical protein
VAIRHNLCTNPALKFDAAGWGGNGSAPVRTDVTAEGFGRQWAAHYVDGSFARTPTGAVTPALDYTFSFYRYVGGAAGTGGNAVYIEWNLSAGNGGPTYLQVSPLWTALTLERVSVTGTAPANAVSAALVVDGSYTARPTDMSMMLIEQVNALDTYFDGDSPAATWDGTPGNSPSTIGAVAAPVPFQGWGVPI